MRISVYIRFNVAVSCRDIWVLRNSVFVFYCFVPSQRWLDRSTTASTESKPRGFQLSLSWSFLLQPDRNSYFISPYYLIFLNLVSFTSFTVIGLFAFAKYSGKLNELLYYCYYTTTAAATATAASTTTTTTHYYYYCCCCYYC